VASLVLVGLPGTGKSAVGAQIAASWGCAFIDTDEMVAQDVGSTTGQYLREHGEPAFRTIECEVLATALEHDAVVATGGGVVTTPEARRLLAGQRTIWLDCADDEILGRLGDGDRPLLGDDPSGAIRRLRNERAAWYREVSRERVDASGTLDEVVARVLQASAKVEQ